MWFSALFLPRIHSKLMHLFLRYSGPGILYSSWFASVCPVSALVLSLIPHRPRMWCKGSQAQSLQGVRTMPCEVFTSNDGHPVLDQGISSIQISEAVSIRSPAQEYLRLRPALKSCWLHKGIWFPLAQCLFGYKEQTSVAPLHEGLWPPLRSLLWGRSVHCSLS